MKRLFALSCNVCAYRGCEEKLADPQWNSVQADLAHIHGERPTAARYDASQTDEQRRAFENIIVLCPNHHRRIDLLEPDEHPPELLFEMKEQHEQACIQARSWATDGELDRYVGLLLARDPDPPPPVGAPRLVIERGSGDSYEVVNVGDADAFDPQIVFEDQSARDATVFTDEGAARLSPGGRWRAILHTPTFGNAGPHQLKLVWTDAAGTPYNGAFTIG